MSQTQSVSYSSPIASNVKAVGKDSPTLQARWRFMDGQGGKRIVVSLRGGADAVMSARHDLGETQFPSGLSISVTGDVILDDVQVEGEDGDFATQTLTYRFRNERETAADVAAGLQRRDIGARWVERQEMIEHWAARSKGGAYGEFNAALFQAWLAEPDPETRASYQVNIGDEAVSLEDGDGGDGVGEGSKLTLGVAQRYNMGVQYAGNRMLQVEVSELWRSPPDISAECNKQLPGGIPQEHRPLFKLDKSIDTTFVQVRAADSVAPAGGGMFARQVIYLCIPKTMAPADPPIGWGDGPVDELLVPTA